MVAFTGNRYFWAFLFSALFSSSAFSVGPPISFDRWSVTNGVINAAACPTVGTQNSTCGFELKDDGFLQRKVTLATGTSYWQVILTDPGVSGNAGTGVGTNGAVTATAPFSAARGNIAYSNENFIRINNRDAGISAKQTIASSTFVTSTQEERLDYSFIFEHGWANGAAKPWILAHQGITTLDYSASLTAPEVIFSSSADMTSDTATNTQYDILLQQRVKLAANEAQGFNYRLMGGQYQNTSHLAGTSPAVLSNGGNISWGAGDPVKALWIGQSTVAQGNGGGLFGLNKFSAYNSTDPYNPGWGQVSQVSFLDTLAAPGWSQAPFNYTPFNLTAANGTGSGLIGLTGWPSPLLNTGVITAATLPIEYQAAPSAMLAQFRLPAITTPITPGIGSPLALDNWSISGGVITANGCDGFIITCSTVAQSNGFLERLITKGGKTYYQTVITDNGVSGTPTAAPFAANSLAFNSESITMAGGTNGLVSKTAFQDHQVVSATTYENVAYSTTLNTGWAETGVSAPKIAISEQMASHDISQNSASNYDRFTYKALSNGSVDLDMFASAGSMASAPLGGPIMYPIMSETRRLSGDFQQTSSPGIVLPTPGLSLAWSPGDVIQANWIGAEYTVPLMIGSLQRIASTAYTNLTTGQRVAYTKLIDPASPLTVVPNPDSWVTPFGPPAPVWTSSQSYLP